MRLHGATASHVGNLRETNQDRAWFKGSVAALADGMGGHQGGERAAELAIGEFKIMPETLTPEELIDVVEEANRQVHKQSVNPDLRGMGTTMVALGLYEGQVLVVNVGDSRAYRYRNGNLMQVTVDHSFVEELVRQGRLTPEEAAIHPQRNIVTRALGIGPEVEVDEFALEPLVGDRYLLASDGLFSEVDAAEIAHILEHGETPAATATELVGAALATPCRDNVTVAVVDVVAEDFVIPEGYEPEQDIDDTKDITAPVPIVDPDVVKITDRPEGGAVRSSGSLLERERTYESVDGDLAYDPFEDDAPESAYLADTDSSPSLFGRLGRIIATLALAAVMFAGVLFAIEWYAKSSYFVGEVEDELVVYQGRKGGFLWVDGELLDYRSGVMVSALTDDAATTFEGWDNFSSIDAAREAIEGLESVEGEAGSGGDDDEASVSSQDDSGSASSSSDGG